MTDQKPSMFSDDIADVELPKSEPMPGISTDYYNQTPDFDLEVNHFDSEGVHAQGEKTFEELKAAKVHVRLLGGVHGMEPQSNEGLKKVRELLAGSSEVRVKEGMVITVIANCNPKALQQNKRFSEGGEDLNRCMRMTDDPQTYEAKMANRIVPYLQGENGFTIDSHSALVKDSSSVAGCSIVDKDPMSHMTLKAVESIHKYSESMDYVVMGGDKKRRESGLSTSQTATVDGGGIGSITLEPKGGHYDMSTARETFVSNMAYLVTEGIIEVDGLNLEADDFEEKFKAYLKAKVKELGLGEDKGFKREVPQKSEITWVNTQDQPGFVWDPSQEAYPKLFKTGYKHLQTIQEGEAYSDDMPPAPNKFVAVFPSDVNDMTVESLNGDSPEVVRQKALDEVEKTGKYTGSKYSSGQLGLIVSRPELTPEDERERGGLAA